MSDLIVKFGENLSITQASIISTDAALSDPRIVEHFKKVADDLKKIAPKADDFLYFSAIMMHAAEASALDNEGNLKKDASGNPVKVGWEINGDSWKWKSSDPSIVAYKNCFPAKTRILMHDGSVKNIEDIQVGDLVITHKNRVKKVKKLFKTPINSELVELSIVNNFKILTTKEHPFYKLNVQKTISNRPQRTLLKTSPTNFEFIEANKLKKSDILLSPVLTEIVESDLTVDKARLLGYFAAEGSYAKKYNKYQGAVLTFNLNEEHTLVKNVISLTKSIFPNSSISLWKSTKKNTCSVYITGKNVVDFFKNHIGEYSSQKTLNKEIVFAPNNIKKAFILGWLEGDGHVEKKYGQVIGITTSVNLASQISLMLSSLNIASSLRFKELEGTYKIINKKYGPTPCSNLYRVEINASNAQDLIKDSINLKFTKRGSFKNICRFYDNYKISTIKDIKNVPFSGDVYNFEVEDDNSYVANNIIVHNCNGDIFPEPELLKAYKKWVGKPLCVDHKSSQVDSVRGIIVDTYYDHQFKRVIALCALDKKSYPELAHKVASGVSASVSMGTAVGKAICYDCGSVARTERDFCIHMRTKSCYGEINCDLNPIELSIVVNGADPKAKIKHVIAAANSLNQYLESKNYKNAAVTNLIETLKEKLSHADEKELEQISEYINNLKWDKMGDALTSAKSLEEVEPFTPSRVSSQFGEGDIETSETNGIASPQEKLASQEKDLNSIKEKVSLIESNLEKLALQINNKEDIMSGDMKKEGFLQGGGGVNEPTLGKPKYEKEKLNEEARNHLDKHMVGKAPFTGVGKPEDLFPGDLEKKKLLKRAEEEQTERKMRRQAALEAAKQAYLQGGGGVNEPTPGKKKYPVDPLNEKARNDLDKAMVGQKPFPGVGDVEGLHPSPASVSEKDELKRKQLLQRASLSLKFVKAAKEDGSDDLANSAWQAYRGDKLVFTASVNELTNGKVEEFYDSVATKKFGTKLFNVIKEAGVEAASKMYKKGQAAPAPEMAPPTAMPEMPQASAPVASAPPASLPEAPAADMGASDPQDRVLQLAEEARNVTADLLEAVRLLTGEQKEMGELESAVAPKTASMKKLYRMRRHLNAGLIDSLGKTAAELKLNEEELKAIAEDILGEDFGSDSEHVEGLVNEAVEETMATIAAAHNLMTAFGKYASGTETLVKQAKKEYRLAKTAQDAMVEDGHGDFSSDDDEVEAWDANDLDGDEELVADTSDDMDSVDEMLNDLDQLDLDLDMADDLEADDSLEDKDEMMAPTVPSAATGVVKDSKGVEKQAEDRSTKEGRSAYRAKLAAKSHELTDSLLDKAHPQGGTTIKFDVKPSGDGAHVEDQKEQHDKIMAVVTAPVKVRKDAEAIHNLIANGELDSADLDALVAAGADKAAVEYYKKYYSQMGREGAEFASELVKEHVKAEVDEQVNAFKVKIARAYEVAYDMAHRGLVADEPKAISAEVEKIMEWNDEAFESVKKVIARHPVKQLNKQASMPSVGLIDNDVRTENKPSDLKSELEALFNRKYR